jgi:large subunit ribosomal protein L5
MPTMTPLRDRLSTDILAALKKNLGERNINAYPKVEKVIIATGINKSNQDSKELHAYIAESIEKITGQRPVLTKAKKAVSNFKTREGNVVGAMVTLRGDRMIDFLDRLIQYVLPRVRDFRGLKSKLDGNGNYSIGLTDHSVFPELPPADAKQIFGLQIQIVTTTNSDEEAKALLDAMNMPFRKNKPVEETKKEQPKMETKVEEVADVEEVSPSKTEGETETTSDTSETPATSETSDVPESNSDTPSE